METMLHPNQMIQLHSFWNLIQATDERVQRELYVMFQKKYAKQENIAPEPSFLQMKGVLRGVGSEDTDKQMLDEYLQEKYGV